MSDAIDSKVPALFDAISALERLGQDYWLCNGTLLGVIRDRKLIPWDVDVDIGVFEGGFDKKATVVAFESEGFSLHDDGLGSDFITFSKFGIKVDINIFVKRGELYVSVWRVVNRGFLPRALNRVVRELRLSYYPFKRLVDRIMYSMEGYSCPEAVLDSFVEVEFSGRNVRVPRDSEGLLEWTYGATWKTPKRDYDWRADGANNAKG